MDVKLFGVIGGGTMGGGIAHTAATTWGSSDSSATDRSRQIPGVDRGRACFNGRPAPVDVVA